MFTEAELKIILEVLTHSRPTAHYYPDAVDRHNHARRLVQQKLTEAERDNNKTKVPEEKPRVEEKSSDNKEAKIPLTESAPHKRNMRTHTALAEHLGWDSREMKENEYQPGRHACKVFTVGNDYMTATKNKAPKAFDGYVWKEIPSHLNAYGWHIWDAVRDNS